MRIALITMGSRGDVQPLLALGVSLKLAGHQVRLVTHAAFGSLIREQGLEFAAAEGNPQQILDTPLGRSIVSSRNPFTAMRLASQAFESLFEQFARDAIVGCEGVDLVGASQFSVFLGTTIAEKLGVPLFVPHVLPIVPTSAFHSPALPAALWVPGLQRLGHRVVRWAAWRVFRNATNQVRRDVFDLPPLRGNPLIDTKRSLTLVGVSRHVMPRPADWPETAQLTGYWFLGEPEGWTPPSALVEFLGAGPAPVYVGFGSMTSDSAKVNTDAVLAALERTGQRGVVQAGWGGLQADQLPPNVIAVGPVHHSWLFPRMAAVIHHGGAGSTAAGLRAGVPSMAVPFFGDQPFWGGRIRALGAGPALIPQRRLTADRLSLAIETMLGDQQMRARSNELGAEIRAEDGGAFAVRAIEAWKASLSE